MDYTATYSNIVMCCYASDMVLLVDSDAACQCLSKAKSRIAGCFYLSDHPSKIDQPKLNEPMLVACKTIRHVASSAVEAEMAWAFTNAQLALPIRYALEAGLDHHQPPTPLKSDNSTTTGFFYNNMHQRRSKSWDIRCHWLRDEDTKINKSMLG